MSIEKLQIILISIAKAIKTRGVFNTLAMIGVALLDEREDRRSGMIAHNFLDPQKTDPHASNIKYANYYQPVRSIPFRKLMGELKPFKNLNFVDIGAGTGKAMILAAEYGFKNIRGVEISEPLCKLAHKNLSHFGPKFKDAQFEIFHADAMIFKFNENDGIFFLNDPFSEEVFKSFVARIQDFRTSIQHPITLIYKNNNLRIIPSLIALKSQVQYSEFNTGGNHFQIYSF